MVRLYNTHIYSTTRAVFPTIVTNIFSFEALPVLDVVVTQLRPDISTTLQRFGWLGKKCPHTVILLLFHPQPTQMASFAILLPSVTILVSHVALGYDQQLNTLAMHALVHYGVTR